MPEQQQQPESFLDWKRQRSVAEGAEAPVRDAEARSFLDWKKQRFQPEQQEEERGMLSKAVERGFRGTAASFAEFADFVGIESAGDFADRQQRAIAKLPAEVSFADIEHEQDSKKQMALAGKFMVEKGVENIPMLLSLVAGGGAAGAGAKAAGAALKGRRAAQITGFGATDFALQAGETKAGIEAEGGEARAANVVPAATLKTAFDLSTPAFIARRMGLGKEMTDALVDAGKRSGFLKEFGKNFAVTAPLEAGTERAQQYVDIVNQKIDSGEGAFSELTPRQKEELKEATAAGFAVGGLFAGVGTAAGALRPGGLAHEQSEAEQQQELQSRLEEQLLLAEQQEQFITEQLEAEGAEVREGNVPRQDEPKATARDIPTWSTIPLDRGKQQIGGEFITFEGDLRTVERESHDMPGVRETFNGRPVSRVRDGEIEQETFEESAQEEGDVAFVDTDIDPATAPKTFMLLDDLTRSIRDTLFPGTRVVITQPQRLLDMSGATKDTNVIVANTGLDESGRIWLGINMSSALEQGKPLVRQQNDLLTTVAHELGHHIEKISFFESSPNTKKALLKGYMEWLNDVKTLPLDEFNDKYAPVGDWKMRMGPPRKKTSGKPTSKAFRQRVRRTPLNHVETNASFTNYHLSFSEYVAQQTARWVQARDRALRDASPETKQFFGDLLKKLRRVFSIFRKKAPRNTETFEQFVELLAVRAEINAIRREMGLEDVTPTRVREMQRSKRRVNIGEEIATNEATTEDMAAEPPEETQPINLADFEAEIGLAAGEVQSQMRHAEVNLKHPNILKILTPLQISQRYRMPQITDYVNRTQEFARTKMKPIEQASEVSRRIMQLSPDQARRFGKFVFEVSIRSDEKEGQLTQEELVEVVEETGINDESLEIWREMDTSFRDVLEGIETGLLIEAARPHVVGSPTEFVRQWKRIGDKKKRGEFIANNTRTGAAQVNLAQRMGKIESSMEGLRNRNYFPRMRFGKYTLVVRSPHDGFRYEDKVFGKGEVVEFRTYESKREREADFQQIKKERRDAAVQKGKLSDEAYSFVGMPQVVIERLRRELHPSKEQQEILNDVALQLAPGRSWLRHLQKRKGTLGYSEDVLRSYANYMMTAANHLARVQHAPHMLESLESLRDAYRNQNIEDTTPLVELHDYFMRHFNYIMSPENDWAKLRSMGFLWFLGFNVRSAALNLTQVPMVTYPVLAGKYTDATAIAEITKAMKDVRGQIEKLETLSDGEKRMMARLAEEGIIDESLAMELAGIGESTLLSQIAPGNSLDRGWNKLMYYGAFMFRAAEKYNRRVSALAGYRAATKNGAGHEAALAEARDVVQKSQFEYQKWNRPEFMRGRKSVIFMFWQYQQHAAYLASGLGGTKADRRAAMRFWSMMFVLGGLTGVPFGEQMLQLLDFFGTKTKDALGVSNPRTALKEDIREMLVEVTDKPDGMLYGLGRYWGLGPLHALELAGAPIPDVDMSASLSLGNIVPWFDGYFEPSNNPDRKLTETMVNVSGPLGQIGYNLYRTSESPSPDTWKNVERNMPSAIKSIMKAVRYHESGALEDSKGARLLEFEGRNPTHQAEIIAQALGFTPTRVSQKWDFIASQREAAMFWQIRRARLLDTLDYAQRSADREGIAAVHKAIRNFNNKVRSHEELKPLVISGDTMRQSLKARRRLRQLRESDMAQNRQMELLNREIRQLYPEVE